MSRRWVSVVSVVSVISAPEGQLRRTLQVQKGMVSYRLSCSKLVEWKMVREEKFMETETKENLQQKVRDAERHYNRTLNEYAEHPERAKQLEPRLQRWQDLINDIQKKLKSF